ncbi:unnamed protein product, partial [Ectocarpus sp. 12 AP-2014]
LGSNLARAGLKKKKKTLQLMYWHESCGLEDRARVTDRVISGYNARSEAIDLLFRSTIVPVEGLSLAGRGLCHGHTGGSTMGTTLWMPAPPCMRIPPSSHSQGG